jgi:xanthine/uracil/vitamin C permease (AzgA family)
MFLATVVVTAVLAALLVATALRKLSHRAEVVQTYERVGVPENRLNLLAGVLLAGAGGILLGLWWAPVGIAAGVGLVAYFLAAIGFHIRADDLRPLPVPVAYAAVSAAALVLRLAS